MRCGVVVDAEHRVVDLNAACALMYHVAGDTRPAERALFDVPPSMSEFLRTAPSSLDVAGRVLDFVARHPDNPAGIRGERIDYGLDEVHLLAPVPYPPVLRDFAGFEDHLRATFGKMGLSVPRSWYDQPLAFKGSVSAIRGPDEVIAWPRYTDKLDYELEICAVIGPGGRDIRKERAREHIAGFTILNDWSARDIQRVEMAMGTGPFKAKDFAWGLGPWITTSDEIPDPSSLRMTVRVNGEVWADVVPQDMYWTFEDMVSYSSQDEDLQPGDLLGSGTVTGGCGFEIERWVQPGDVVELDIEGIGTLRQYVGSKPSEPRIWANTHTVRSTG
jgi:2-keto-4-pentenoate hydratase/2-oxohepta-3-ene-1,7-dioic acid hydratase in catechol pathway